VVSWCEEAPCPILLTGGDQPGNIVRDMLFRPDRAMRLWETQRVPGSFHGTGCTLSSAVATMLAQGHALPEATDRAIGYVQFLVSHASHGILPHGRPPDRRPR